MNKPGNASVLTGLTFWEDIWHWEGAATRGRRGFVGSVLSLPRLPLWVPGTWSFPLATSAPVLVTLEAGTTSPGAPGADIAAGMSR